MGRAFASRALLLLLAFLFLRCSNCGTTHPDPDGAPRFHSRWFDWEAITESVSHSSIIEDLPTRKLDFPGGSIGAETDAWILSGNLADYRMFKPVLSLSVPVPVNLIFIGFDGDGAQSLELEKHDFKEWFEHIEHHLRHTIVPVGEEQTTTERHETPSTPIKYRFQFNLIKLHPLVNTVLEDVILWHIRPEDPDHGAKNYPHKPEPTRYYVDAFKVSRVLEHLLMSLNLTDAYTLLILNPKSAVEEGEVYGYRVGFSDAEIAKIRMRQTEWGVIENTKKTDPKAPEEQEELAPIQKKAEPEASNQADQENQKLRWSNLVDHSEAWARWFVKSRGAKSTAFCSVEGAEDDPRCISKSQGPERMDVMTLVKEMAAEGTQAQKRYLQRIRDGLEHEDCLVDTWLGHSRFGFIDLSAGPFKWGPIVAGHGVRSNTTLPRVPKYASLQADRKTGQEMMARREERRKKAAIDSKVRDALEARKMQNDDPADAELELLKGYYAQHCGAASRKFNDKQNFVNCNFLSEKIKDLEKKAEKNTPPEGNLFTGSEEEGEGESMVLDNFLSNLGAVISASLRHVITPPAPLFPAYHTQRVTFHFFLISNQNEPLKYFEYDSFKRELLKLKLPTQEFSFVMKEIDMREDRELLAAFHTSFRTSVIPSLNTAGDFTANHVRYIDSKALQHQLGMLALHEAEDERLAEEEEQLIYKNEQLKKRKEQEPSKKQAAKNVHSGKDSFSRHIPIFFFSLLNNPVDTPVFIDKYYLAKALADMVIIVQSQSHSWESRLACNDKPIYWDLRNPLKPALAATMLHYGGLIPAHITYDEANKAASQNWLWSVGDNPLGHTSKGHHFSQIHRDTVLRNFIVNALADSVTKINEAIRILMNIPTTLNNFKAPIPGMEMTAIYRSIRKYWETAAEHVKNFEFAEAIAITKVIESNAKRFKKLAIKTANVMNAVKCEAYEGTSTGGDSLWNNTGMFVVGVAVNLLLVILFLTVRRRKAKVKTN